MTEVCPSCGQFCDRLDDATGWCDECIAIPTDSKPCVRCGTVRCLDAFREHPRAASGRRGVCKVCEREIRAAWRHAHREREAATEHRRYLRRQAERTTA